MTDIAEFVAQNYYHNDTVKGVSEVRDLLSFPGVYSIGIPDDGLVMIYMTLSERGLERLRQVKDESDFTPSLTSELLSHPGKHVYIFRLVSINKPKLHDLRDLREQVIKRHNALSVSWHDDHRVFLHTYEVH